MSIWPFNRKDKQEQSVVAGEVQDYYQSERRERKGVAWLLALATFFVTLFAVLVLFYGGKWAYNKIRSDETNTTDVVEEQTSDQANQGEQDASQNQDEAQSSGSDSSNDSNDSANVNGQSDEPQTSSTSTSTPSSTTTPTTGPSDEELPRTGPDQDL